MKRFLLPSVALIFLVVAAACIATWRPVRHVAPAQQVELSHGVQYGAVIKDFLFVQEITLRKRYLERVDIYMAKLPSAYPNRNVFLLLDDQGKILFTRPFSSDDFGEALYFPFDPGKSLDIGAGKTVYACLYSLDGDQGSYIGLARKEGGDIGKLWVVSVTNGDVTGSFERKQGLVEFEGCIGTRTFESDTRYFSGWQIVLYLLSALVAVLIFYGRQITAFLAGIRLVPERIYPLPALVMGLLILALNPPFMVPDEPVHFYRSYQISEGNFLKGKDDFPKSLTEMSDRCDRMRFSTHEKTNRGEILSLGGIRNDPQARTTVTTPDYILPYLPQATGIAMARAIGLSPLWMFYLGRIFNLLVSVLLVYLAIRTAPVFKWVFFLLGMMPMTLYQFASLSYDAVTAGLSFLLLAFILKLASGPDRPVSRREMIVSFILVALLAAAKQPYVVLGLVVFIIPRKRFGPLVRYAILMAGLFLTALVFSLYWAPARKAASLFGQRPSVEAEHRQTATLFSAFDELLASDPGVQDSPAVTPQPGEAGDGGQAPGNEEAPTGQPPAQAGAEPQANPVVQVNPIDPEAQKRFILEDPVRYIGILLHTAGASFDLYVTSFVGLFGWIDTPMPPAVSYLFLFVLILLSLAGGNESLTITWKNRALFAGVFILAFVLIETALYVYCNPVGVSPVTAVQGRYFIPASPLLFLMFAATGLPSMIRRRDRRKAIASKSRKPVPSVDPNGSTPRWASLLPWVAMASSAGALATAFYVLLERYYVLAP